MLADKKAAKMADNLVASTAASTAALKVGSMAVKMV